MSLLTSTEDGQIVGANRTHPFIAALTNHAQQNRTSGPIQVFPTRAANSKPTHQLAELSSNENTIFGTIPPRTYRFQVSMSIAAVL